MLKKTVEERFFDKIQKTKTCWLWVGYTNPKGYGSFRFRGRACQAHRVAYLLFVGDIPNDRPEIDHLCNIRGCVNPAHLEPVTRQENCRRASARITQCLRGHEYTKENTLWHTWRGYTNRHCKQCSTIYCKLRYEALKEAA